MFYNLLYPVGKNHRNLLSILCLCAVNVINPTVSFAESKQETFETAVPAIIVKKNKSTGQYEVPINFSGSATYISPQELDEKSNNDINRIIRSVPGVNITEENGYGYRPNISLRGSRSERSADITLMEDGVLAAPAPYSAPSAYYFPSMGRTKGIEIRKGASSIKYGPKTTSGVINFITTPIPQFEKGQFASSVGSFNEKNANFNYGDSAGNFGYVVNFDHQSSDGFKKLDGGGDTGFSLQDYMVKMRLKSDKDADIYQHLELKVAAHDELSKEGYLGLSLDDYMNGDKYRRYRASALDEMNADHQMYQLTHYMKPSDNFNLTTTLYYNEFKRNWYKLDKVDGTSVKDIMKDIDAYASEFSAIKGEGAGTLSVKSNGRSFASYGLQSNAKSKIMFDRSIHHLEYGFRYHTDYEDRLNYSDDYSINSSGVIALTSAGEVGATDANNRRGTARTISAFVEDEIEIGQFRVVPGARLEHIELKRENHVSNSIDRNTEDAFVPGISSSYLIKEDLSIFAGIYKGFSTPSPGSDASIEESVNYEIGSRYRSKDDTLFLESVFFLNDYKNLLGTDTGSGAGTGDQYNGGEVRAYGLELSGRYNIATKVADHAITIPLQMSYTYNHAEFQTSFTENGIDEWGDVKSGDELPYIANHQIAMTVGLEVNKFSLYLSNKFVSDMRGKSGQGAIAQEDKIPAHFITDLSSFYEFDKGKRFFIAVDNIFNKEYIASLKPAGIRPGKPLTARLGVKIDF